MTTSRSIEVKLKRCSSIALRDCLDLKEGERIIILTDAQSTAMWPHVLFEGAQDLGGETRLLMVSEVGAVLNDPLLMGFLNRSEIVIACTSKAFPVSAREQATREGARVLLMHTVTDEIAIRTIPIDYEKLRLALVAMTKPLQSEELTMITRKGTELRFSCKGRPVFKFDGFCRDKGEYDSLPAGAIYSSPIEGTGEGTIVVDGSGYDTGVIRCPIKLRVEQGVVTRVSGGQEAARLRKLMREGGRNAGNFAEVGFGVNPAARLSGHPIESERSAGTATIGLGRNTQMGGTVHSPVHLDIGVISAVTLKANGTTIINDGRLSLEAGI